MALFALALGCQSVEPASKGTECQSDLDCKRSERCAPEQGRCVPLSGAASDGAGLDSAVIRDIGVDGSLPIRDADLRRDAADGPVDQGASIRPPDTGVSPPDPNAAFDVSSDAAPVEGPPDTVAVPPSDASVPGPREIGAVCDRDRDCDEDVCLEGAEFPHGYCSMTCDVLVCPRGTRCVELDAEAELYCLRECAAHDDCRGNEGYVCDLGLCVGAL